jgi:hypothetical protein
MALQQNSDVLAVRLSDTEQSQQRDQQHLAQLQREMERSQQQMLKSAQDVAALDQQLAQQRANQSISDASLQQLQDELDTSNAALLQARQQHAVLENSSRKREQQLQSAAEEIARQSRQASTVQEDTQSEKIRLAAELQQREQQLQDTGQQLLLARAALQMERAKVSQAVGQTSGQQAEMVRQQAELAALSAQLQQQYTLVKTQKSKIRELESQAQTFTDASGAAAIEVDDRVASMGEAPRIEIIEPPVVLVRSMPTVKLLSRGGEQQLVGKILAPSGILSLSVNGKPVTLDNNNLFHTNIPLDIAPKPVNVVVVDKQGRRAAVAFTYVEELAESQGRQQQTISKPLSKKAARKQRVKLGNYYALIIGNNDYQQFSTLATAVNDARETDKLLRQKYKFKTRLLLNADRYSILSALNELRETLGEDDNLLIYYAGHGILDDTNDRGYWLPVDADTNNNANWISNTAITDILNVINAKHILVVADSCFSGTLTQTPLARSQADIPTDVRTEWIKVMAETRARITLTSGGLEPVLDGGGGAHSLFAKAFLATLRNNDEILEGYSLYYQILNRMGSNVVSSVAERSGQVPQYAPIHLAGHESGEFFFSPI